MNASMIDLTAADGGAFRAYHAVPEQPNGGAVVVLQEIFGLTANIRGIVDSLAAAGYNAIAPDLFWRQTPGLELNPGLEADRDRAQALLKGLDADLAVSDALVAGRYVLDQPGSNGRLGVVGYCLGGKLSYLLAMQPRISAAVSYYGVAIQHILGQADRLRAPLLLHVAEQDHLCPPEAQAAIRDAMADRYNVSVMSYPGVGHAFARRESPHFDAASAARADAATMDLLAIKVVGV